MGGQWRHVAVVVIVVYGTQLAERAIQSTDDKEAAHVRPPVRPRAMAT